MKRRDPELERARWREGFPQRRWWRLTGQSIVSSAVAAALGFGMVLAIGVVLYGPADDVQAGWAFMEQAQR